jgi:hypothetical protein
MPHWLRAPAVGMLVALLASCGDGSTSRQDATDQAETEESQEAAVSSRDTVAGRPFRADSGASPELCTLAREIRLAQNALLARRDTGTYLKFAAVALDNNVRQEMLPDAPGAILRVHLTPEHRTELCRLLVESEHVVFLEKYNTYTERIPIGVASLLQMMDSATAAIRRTQASPGPTQVLTRGGDTATAKIDPAALEGVGRRVVEKLVPWLALVVLLGIASVGTAAWKSHQSFRRLNERVDRILTDAKANATANEQALKYTTKETSGQIQEAKTEVLTRVQSVYNTVLSSRNQIIETQRALYRSGGEGDGRGGGGDTLGDQGVRWLNDVETESAAVDLTEDGDVTRDPSGVIFTVQWVEGGRDGARLWVNDDAVLSGSDQKYVDAAFTRPGDARRPEGRYQTLRPAQCTWDPRMGKGRIEVPGELRKVD